MIETKTTVTIICDICKIRDVKYDQYTGGLSIIMPTQTDQSSRISPKYDEVCPACYDAVLDLIKNLKEGGEG